MGGKDEWVRRLALSVDVDQDARFHTRGKLTAQREEESFPGQLN